MQLDNFVQMDQQGKGTFDTRKFHKIPKIFKKSENFKKLALFGVLGENLANFRLIWWFYTNLDAKW